MSDLKDNQSDKNNYIKSGKKKSTLIEDLKEPVSKINLNSAELTEEAKLKLSNLAEEAKKIWKK